MNVLKIGKGHINSVYALLKENKIDGKILYVYDEIVDELYGDIVRAQLEHIGVLKKEEVEYNTIASAMELAERIIATDITCVVGLGGGKVLDVCKYAAYISKVPFISLPTAIANDGIASPIAVLKRQDDIPKSLGCEAPQILIVDTDIIVKSPKVLIQAGIGDTISNYMALKDWRFACDKNKDVMNGYAYLMSEISLNTLLKTQYNELDDDFVNVLVNSIVMSGIAMKYCGTSRPVSGSEHLFSHALDFYSKNKNLHGIQVAIGTIAMLKLIEEDYSSVLKYLNKFKVNVNPASLNIDEDTFVYCLQNASKMRPNRYTYLDVVNLESAKLKKLYKELNEEL